MIKKFHGNKARLRRHQRMRNQLEGTVARPRLSVYRSGTHMYAQIIDDTTGKTLVAACRSMPACAISSPRQWGPPGNPRRKAEESEAVEIAAAAAPAA